MKYLLLVSHASLAQGLEGALEMLLGPRAFVLACGMEDGMSPEQYRAKLTEVIAPVAAGDEVVVLGDIAGGSPLKNTLAVLDEKGLAGRVMAFGGVNLAMAISALMGIEDGLPMDDMRHALLSEGVQAVKQV